MKTPAKIAVILTVAVAVLAAFVLKNNKSCGTANPAISAAVTAVEAPASGQSDAAAKLPKLLDLGSDKCVPCKMMAPVLEDLGKEYAGRLKVEFIDIWKNEDAGKKYGVEMIPTQIFYDANGKELFRHTGFFGKEGILAKWRELGVDIINRDLRGSPSAADGS